LLPLVFAIVSLFAPAMWGIALNQETQECAGYWSGDEFTHYPLPSGWKAYYPDEEGLIHTDVGVCRLPAQECCQQLGYTFVAENIGKEHKTKTNRQLLACLCPLFALGLLLATLAVIYLIRRTLRRDRPPKWLQTIKKLWQDNVMRMSSISMIVTFPLAAVSLIAMWVFLDLESWGHPFFSLSAVFFLAELYGQGIKVATVLWYLGTVILLVLCWKLTERSKIQWIRILVRTISVAILLAPGIFIDIDAPGLERQTSVLPALVCAARYRQISLPQFWEGASWVTSLWLIPVIWLVELCIIFLRRVRELRTQHRRQSESRGET
jgi:hypothetical protein